MAFTSQISIDEFPDLPVMSRHDPVFDCVLMAQELERDGYENAIDLAHSTVTVDWDLFPEIYYQYRQWVNWYRRSQVRIRRGLPENFKGNPTRVFTDCPICGKNFPPRPDRGSSARKYCGAECFAESVSRRRKKQSKRIEFQGELYSAQQLAKRFGVNASTINRRYKDGTLDVVISGKVKKQIEIIIKGESFTTAQVGEMTGVDPKQIRKRIDRGTMGKFIKKNFGHSDFKVTKV